MTKDEVLMMALEALKANDLLINGTEKAGGLAWCIDGYYSDCFDIDPINEQTERAITAIKEALAQHDSVQAKPETEQEPVAWPHKYGCRANAFGKCDMGCTTPPQRTWVDLTDEEIGTIAYSVNPLDGIRQFSRAIEAKLKEKNT